MTDRFGVPDNTFGRVDDDFYGLLGRIVALGALVEMNFAILVMRLENTTEEAIAGCPIGQLYSRFDTAMETRTSTDVPARDVLVSLRKRTESAMKRRNALVHSLWSAPTSAEANGWRTVTKRQREVPDKYVVWTTTDEPGLIELVAELVELSLQLRDV